MIQRTYPDTLTAWRSLVEELCYHTKDVGGLCWGVCIAYPDLLEVEIKDALLDNEMHLGMSSYTKSRWTRFLRRYFRTDFQSWIDKSIDQLTVYPSRPFVASYSVNLNEESIQLGVGAHGGHKYGGCLSSLQIRIHPIPTVILYSRACQMDKIGFLDFTLMHLVAKRMSVHPYFKKTKRITKIEARWVASLPFISAISQVFYTNRFKLPMKGHALERRIRQNRNRPIEDVIYGPLKRLIKRNAQMKEFGEIPNSCPVKELSLEFTDQK